MRDLGVRRRELLHLGPGQAAEVFCRARQRGEGRPSGLVRQRDVEVGAAGQRREQGPLRPGQILEAVREDGSAVPRVELVLDPGDSVPALEVAIPELEPVELRAVGREQGAEVAGDLTRVDEARLELRDGAEQRLAEAGEPGRRA